MTSIIQSFTDPVLQAPTIGSMLMCLASALIGVIVFLRKRSLLGEALSHASYPGVVLSVLVVAALFPTFQEVMPVAILIGASATSFLGLWAIERLERRFSIKSDAALCFILSVFFGVGILIASRLQVTHALWYKTIQIFLYGQAATLTDVHIVIYTVLVVMTIGILIALFRQIEMVIFDRSFSKCVGIKVSLVDTVLFALLILAIVIGIRSVGVVLMAGMLIAPAVTARQLTNRLSVMLVLAAIFGAVSGFLGNYLSVMIPEWGQERGLEWKFSLPTGPMILLSASCMSIFALLFASEKGIVSRSLRIAAFRIQCLSENLLKYFWKQGKDGSVSVKEIHKWHHLGSWQVRFLLWNLRRQGWVEKNKNGHFALTRDGWLRGERIVRLHRLWEVYLVYLGQGVEKVHRSAEEMEHILTPELEKELTELLQDPRHDPHDQPIPRSKELL
ncbi:MAG: metal ABC transporter permease [Verrucomicrobia bacterium]|nr:metal ABC transporter permease [Verrucomicrobiota bacterium]